MWPQRSANKPIRFRRSIGSPSLFSRLGNIFMIDVITWMKSYLPGTMHSTGNNYWLTCLFRYYRYSLTFSFITNRKNWAYTLSFHSRKLLRLDYSYDVSQLEKQKISKFLQVIVDSKRAKQLLLQVNMPYTNVLPKS